MRLISNTQITRSPLNYTGGKYKLLPQIIPLFPNKISTFVDLFCGGCNVALNVEAKKIICNDIDSNLIGLLSFLKDHSYEALIVEIKRIIKEFNLSDTYEFGYSFYNCSSSSGLSTFNKIGFLKLRSAFNSLPQNSENYYLYLYVLIVYTFNNQIRFNSEGKFNLPVGKRDFNIKMQEKLRNFLCIANNKDILFSNCCFSHFSFKDLNENDFVYADPPYLITCATYNEQSWNEEEEKKLLVCLDELTERGVRFALSNVLSTDNKENLILNEWLKQRDYNCHHLVYSYKNSSYHKKNIAKTDEILITNY